MMIWGIQGVVVADCDAEELTRPPADALAAVRAPPSPNTPYPSTKWTTFFVGLPDERRWLYEYVAESVKKEESFHCLEFEFLQRLNIVQFQLKLAKLKGDIHSDRQFPGGEVTLSKTLEEYTTAVRDYQYMRSLPRLSRHDTTTRSQRFKRYFHAINKPPHYPLNSHYFYAYVPPPPTDAVRAFVQRYLPNSLTFSQEEKTYRPKEYAAGMAAESISPFVDRLTRFVIAFVGGAFLLVPMLIMAIHPSKTKSLITTCVAVLLFAAVVAFGVQGGNVETMASTATYAAVLVVFIGTSNP